MVKTNKERQADYQHRQQEARAYRLDAYISADARAALEKVVQREGITRKDAVEQSILNEAKGRTQMTTTIPTQMTVAEHQELDRFKAQLPTALLNVELDAREVQANGGAAGVTHKQRMNASLFANNMHHHQK